MSMYEVYLVVRSVPNPWIRGMDCTAMHGKRTLAASRLYVLTVEAVVEKIIDFNALPTEHFTTLHSLHSL